MITLTQARLATFSQRCLYTRCSNSIKFQDQVTNTPRSLRSYQSRFSSDGRSQIKYLNSEIYLNKGVQTQCELHQPENHLKDTRSKFAAGSFRLDATTKGLGIYLPPIASKLKAQLLKPHHERGYQDSSTNDSNHGGTNDSRSSFNLTMATTLAVLGIFAKPTTGDIQEERAKLSDKEKWEKMKPIEEKIALGVLWMCDQEYGKANELFHTALRMAQDDENEEQENLVLNLIATNYFESGDWENAEKLFIDLIKRLVAKDMPTTSPAILELSLKLASIYSKSQSTHEKALKGFKFVINSLLQELHDVLQDIDQLDVQTLNDEKRDALALLGWSYDWFAKHLLAMNDYNGAADMLQRALQISSKVLGQLHDQTLILLNDIGTTLAMNNAPEEGRTFMKKAVEGAIETQSKELASFYVNLGLVNLKLKKLQEAKRYCEYSIELVGKNRDHHNSNDVIELSKSCLNEVRRLVEANDK